MKTKRDFELSLLIPEGIQYSCWHPIEQDILSELIRCEFIENCEDDCGATLGEILPTEQLIILACNLGTKDSFGSLREIVKLQTGYLDTDALLNFLKKLMIVGNGECPFCGSPNCHDRGIIHNWDFDNTEKTATEWDTPPARVCDNCNMEWSVEE